MNRIWLQLAKLKVIRNVAVAFVIAIASVAITWVVNWKAQETRTSPTVQLPAPAALFPNANDKTGSEPTVEPAGTGNRSRIIPAGDIYDQKIEEHLINNPRDRWGMDGFDVGQGDQFAVAIRVESGAGFTHSLQIDGEQRRSHFYMFDYSCGCQAMVSPDPYRDVIYSDPAQVAAKYANKLCRDCKRLQAVLDSSNAAPGNPEQAE